MREYLILISFQLFFTRFVQLIIIFQIMFANVVINGQFYNHVKKRLLQKIKQFNVILPNCVCMLKIYMMHANESITLYASVGCNRH